MGPLEIVFASDHPAARGHFPGNPIIPGAVLLSEVLHAVETALGADLSRCRLSAKFPAPSRPGDRVEIGISTSRGGYALLCVAAGRTVLKAEVVCGDSEVACTAAATPD